MNEKPAHVKVELQRADITGRITKDLALSRSTFVKTLGSSWSDVFKKGQGKRANDRAVIFQQGDPGASLLFLLSGHVRLVARKDTDTVELGLAHAGDVIGEAEALVGQGPRSMSAVANGVVEFVELDRALLFGTGAPLERALEQWLASLKAERVKKLDDMTDFLNRW